MIDSRIITTTIRAVIAFQRWEQSFGASKKERAFAWEEMTNATGDLGFDLINASEGIHKAPSKATPKKAPAKKRNRKLARRMH